MKPAKVGYAEKLIFLAGLMKYRFACAMYIINQINFS
jgi:hypothetical protein